MDILALSLQYKGCTIRRRWCHRHWLDFRWQRIYRISYCGNWATRRVAESRQRHIIQRLCGPWTSIKFRRGNIYQSMGEWDVRIGIFWRGLRPENSYVGFLWRFWGQRL